MTYLILTTYNTYENATTNTFSTSDDKILLDHLAYLSKYNEVRQYGKEPKLDTIAVYVIEDSEPKLLMRFKL